MALERISTDLINIDQQYHYPELEESILKFGILNPVILRKVGERYDIGIGFKRCYFAKKLKMTTIPAYVYNLTDSELFELRKHEAESK